LIRPGIEPGPPVKNWTPIDRRAIIKPNEPRRRKIIQLLLDPIQFTYCFNLPGFYLPQTFESSTSIVLYYRCTAYCHDHLHMIIDPFQRIDCTIQYNSSSQSRDLEYWPKNHRDSITRLSFPINGISELEIFYLSMMSSQFTVSLFMGHGV